MDWAIKITFDHNRPRHCTKLKWCKDTVQLKIDRFGDMNRVNSSNFNAMILKFSEKFYHLFLFGNMFTESHGFVAMPVTSCIKDTCSNLFLSN